MNKVRLVSNANEIKGEQDTMPGGPYERRGVATLFQFWRIQMEELNRRPPNATSVEVDLASDHGPRNCPSLLITLPRIGVPGEHNLKPFKYDTVWRYAHFHTHPPEKNAVPALESCITW